jgi:hypothetical protein
MGIRPDAHGDLPSSSMRRLRRQANVTAGQVDPTPLNYQAREGD